MTKVIELNDGLEVEIEVDDNNAYQISNGAKIDSSIENIQSILLKIMKPISETYQNLSENINIESTKISVGIKIGAEGNFILAKSSIGANIKVQMTLKPKKVN